MAAPADKKLSGNIMKMKFMQRKMEADHRQKLEEEQRKHIDESHWVLPMSSNIAVAEAPQVEIETSFFKFDEDLQGCTRRSFKNFNPEIERLNMDADARESLERAEEIERRETVSDEEMVRRYESQIGQPGQGMNKRAKPDTPVEERKGKKRFFTQPAAKNGGKPGQKRN
eukprot:Colp12_sorted_trinity150504_noHs@5827